MTKADFETWVAKLPAKDQEEAKGFFTVIRKGGGTADSPSFPIPWSTRMISLG